MLEEVCGTCRHHINVDGEWVCLNKNSDEYGLETGYEDGDDCDYWRGRER